MYILVTYDIRGEEQRRKVRSLLRKYSFAMLAYSVYIGRGNRGVAERLASRISKLLSPGDRAALILLQDFQYELLMDIRFERVTIRGEEYNVKVFYGRSRRSGGPNDNTRRPTNMRATSQDHPGNGNRNGSTRNA